MVSYSPTTSEKSKSNAVKSGSNSTALKAEDNRPEAIAQRKLQEAANNSLGVKQLMTYQAMANEASQPVQLKLKRGLSKDDEDKLIDAYHASERAGDDFSVASKIVMDHETAMSHYANALANRSSANDMHVRPDAGHMKAIKVVEGKITRRRKIIAKLNQAVDNKKRQADALKKRNEAAAAAAAPGEEKKAPPRRGRGRRGH